MSAAGAADGAVADLAVELLIWMYGRRSAAGIPVPLGQFVSDEDPRAAPAEAAARMLRGRGHLTLEYVFGGALVGPTEAGLAEADQVTRARGRVDAQFGYVLDELVRQAAEAPDAVVRLVPFLARTRFLGLPLREGIVRRAARYLQGHGLAQLWTDDPDAPALMLTSRGEDCAMSLSTSTVRHYMNDQRPHTAPAFIMNVYGGAAAQGMAVTQNLGGPAAGTALLAERIRALAAEHGLGGAAFDADVALVQDVDQDPARRAGAWHRIRAGLLQAAPALAGQTALAGIELGLGLLTR
ncbi:hypothetical protein [Streptomyces katrae]|uniref:hypothetical protein n=1 Tax=Streptomyces katrae TaxID=68223 RepID=UPI0004C049E1|nr:hypothetical protein [Streptomyces katrae]